MSIGNRKMAKERRPRGASIDPRVPVRWRGRHGINSAGHVYEDGRCIPSSLLEGLGGDQNAL